MVENLVEYKNVCKEAKRAVTKAKLKRPGSVVGKYYTNYMSGRIRLFQSRY